VEEEKEDQRRSKVLEVAEGDGGSRGSGRKEVELVVEARTA
jgi:hypothetical protein